MIIMFGVKIELHRNNKNRLIYFTKLTVKQVERILSTRLNTMAICDERKRLILYYCPMSVRQLLEFYKMKLNLDRYIIDNHITTKGWHVG